MQDEPRADAQQGLKALTDAGIKVVMLTGDNDRSAAVMGSRLGIEVRAKVLPHDKQRPRGRIRSREPLLRKTPPLVRGPGPCRAMRCLILCSGAATTPPTGDATECEHDAG
jgi:hypothetical protein